MDAERDLEGRHALVTGAGRGIGAAIARALAEAGGRLTLTARSGAEIEAVAESLRGDGVECIAHPCDVGDEQAVSALREAALAAFGPVDLLINNAGVADSAPLARITLEHWERLMRTNATGAFLCTRAFAPEMAARGWGRVINVASTAGLRGARYVAAYTASKHALVGLTRALAIEMASSGVTVNAVCPSYVDTSMTERTLANITRRTGLEAGEALEAVLADMPQARLLDPAEVAWAVLCLCRSEAGGINGQAIVIDGGEGAA